MSASNLVSLTQAEALTAGAELWLLENDSQSYWWNELDFRAGFLFSKSLNHPKIQLPDVIQKLLIETQMKSYSFSEDENTLLLGSAQHFHNNWILLWKKNPEAVCEKLESMASSLKIKNLRIFLNGKSLNPIFQARLTASFNQISYVEAP